MALSQTIHPPRKITLRKRLQWVTGLMKMEETTAEYVVEKRRTNSLSSTRASAVEASGSSTRTV